ncbi:MAG: hypothetical protein CVV23_08990 [Ignavibacteriae bacterium HGW-Ignavibacteriae-2]|jgi:hypothetical protein|nr:MAG: hypothetical protein CVV23_08990 [Ignavibacteriae bacterium HGW-Ignavibacteriae-2]
MTNENNQSSNCNEKDILRTKWRRILTAYFITIVALLSMVLSTNWPSDAQINKFNPGRDTTYTPTNGIVRSNESEINDSIQTSESTQLDFNMKPNSKSENQPVEPVSSGQMILLVVIVGAFGACLHGLASLGEYVGNKDFNENWIIWYISRPFVGGLLSLLFFFIFLWGFDFGIKDPNGFYGLIALSGLVGLFSKQAMYKLSDIFDVVFQSKKEEQLKNKLEVKNPVPDILKTVPHELRKGDDGTEIKIEGCDFIKESIVRANGKDLPTTFVNSKNLSAKLVDINLTKTDILKLTVFNPPPQGGISRVFEIAVK